MYHLIITRSSQPDDPHWSNHLTLSRSSEGVPLLRPSYQKFFCRYCQTLDKEGIFDRGFDEGPMIWMKGGQEVECTPDGFLCVHARVLSLLMDHAVNGFESKPIPLTPWHVLRITQKVASSQKQSGTACAACGRSAGHGGWDVLEDLVLPSDKVTFVTTRLESQQGYEYCISHRAQPVLVTEGLADVLTKGRVVAGMLTRVLSSQELDTLKESKEKGIRIRLSHPIVRLL